ncbi:hypothetical protein NG744_09155 [Aliarcobacter cryaerophilus]|uniref:hypothetical protein n=1 Tax=Aliarcobacter cryaerophilus TaxID=28198 RepID=UPI003DA3A251
MQYHANCTLDQKISLVSGLTKAIQLASTNNKELLIYTGNKSIFEGNIFTNAIGKDIQKELLKNREFKNKELTIFLEFPNSKKSNFKKGVIIVPFATLSDYNVAFADNRCVDIIFTPWMEIEYTEYIKKNSNSILI